MTRTNPRNIEQYFSLEEQVHLRESGREAELERLREVIDIRLDYLEAGAQERYHRLVAELERIHNSGGESHERLTAMIALTDTPEYRIEIPEGAHTPERSRGDDAGIAGAVHSLRQSGASLEQTAREAASMGFIPALMVGIGRWFQKAINWIREWLGLEPIDPEEEATAAAEAAAERARQEAEATGRESVGETLAGVDGPFSRLNIHPVVDAKIRELAQDRTIFSESDIAALRDADPLDMAAIRSQLTVEKWNLLIERLRNDPEVGAAIQEITITNTARDIQEAYGVSFTPESRERFREIFQRRFGDSLQDYSFERLTSGEEIAILPFIMSAGFELLTSTIGFVFDLVWQGILPISVLAYSVTEAGVMMLQTPFGLLGLGDGGGVIELLGNIEDENQRRFMLASIYRQSGVFATFLSSIAYGVSRMSLDMMNPSSVSVMERVRVFFGGFDGRMQFFQQLESMIPEGDGYIGTIRQSLSDISKNYNIMHIMQDINEGNRIEKIRAINALGYLQETISESTTIQGLRTVLNPKIRATRFPTLDTIPRFMSNVVPGDIHYTQRFRGLLEGVTSFQANYIAGNYVGRVLTKHREIIAIMQAHRHAEHLGLRVSNTQEVLSILEKMKLFAHEFPEVARALFRGVPTLAFLGLDVRLRDEDTSTLESIYQSMTYMMGIVGPVRMMISASTSISEEGVQFYNIAEAGMGATFFVIDATIIGGILARNGISGTSARSIGNLIIRPVTDIAHLGYHTGRGIVGVGQGVYGIATGTRSINIGPALRNALNTRSIAGLGQATARGLRTGKGKLAIGAAAIAAGAYIFMPNRTPEFQHLVDAGVMDENGNLTAIDAEGRIIPENIATLRTYLGGLQSSEREALIAVMVQSGVEEYLLGPEGNYAVGLDGDRVTLTAQSEIASGDWLVQPQIAELLGELGYSTEIIPYQGSNTAHA